MSCVRLQRVTAALGNVSWSHDPPASLKKRSSAYQRRSQTFVIKGYLCDLTPIRKTGEL